MSELITNRLRNSFKIWKSVSDTLLVCNNDSEKYFNKSKVLRQLFPVLMAVDSLASMYQRLKLKQLHGGCVTIVSFGGETALLKEIIPIRRLFFNIEGNKISSLVCQILLDRVLQTQNTRAF